MSDLFHSKRKKKVQEDLGTFYFYWNRLREETPQGNSVKSALKAILVPMGQYNFFLDKCDDIEDVTFSYDEGLSIDYKLTGRGKQTIIQTPDIVKLKDGDELTEDVAAYMVAMALAGGMKVLSFSDCTAQERISLEQAAMAARVSFVAENGDIYSPANEEIIDADIKQDNKHVNAQVLPDTALNGRVDQAESEIKPNTVDLYDAELNSNNAVGQTKFTTTFENMNDFYSYSFNPMDTIAENKAEVTESNVRDPLGSILLFKCSRIYWHASSTPSLTFG